MAIGRVRARKLMATRSYDSAGTVGRVLSAKRATLTDYWPFLVSVIHETVTYGDHMGQAGKLGQTPESS